MYGNVSQEQFQMEIYRKNAAAQNRGHIFCEPAQDVPRAPLWGNLQEKVPQPRDVTQIEPAQDVKKKHSCETSFKHESGRCENNAFLRGFPQKVKLASVTKKP